MKGTGRLVPDCNVNLIFFCWQNINIGTYLLFPLNLLSIKFEPKTFHDEEKCHQTVVLSGFHRDLLKVYFKQHPCLLLYEGQGQSNRGAKRGGHLFSRRKNSSRASSRPSSRSDLDGIRRVKKKLGGATQGIVVERRQ